MLRYHLEKTLLRNSVLQNTMPLLVGLEDQLFRTWFVSLGILFYWLTYPFKSFQRAWLETAMLFLHMLISLQNWKDMLKYFRGQDGLESNETAVKNLVALSTGMGKKTLYPGQPKVQGGSNNVTKFPKTKRTYIRSIFVWKRTSKHSNQSIHKCDLQ